MSNGIFNFLCCWHIAALVAKSSPRSWVKDIMPEPQTCLSGVLWSCVWSSLKGSRECSVHLERHWIILSFLWRRRKLVLELCKLWVSACSSSADFLVSLNSTCLPSGISTGDPVPWAPFLINRSYRQYLNTSDLFWFSVLEVKGELGVIVLCCNYGSIEINSL